ncbi:unnamed protein product [Arabidopsis lyrata]|uniref:Predicted protein n=1 Tax=Arabidopsis lyrata subsp. lyrata TaxID=81972 RepID=D7KM12_ARALL|nr:predicted protein [Arabidopsis lyrata subsp. lyrata]CAH8254543.1 unnamed protein product [Arabidopsis lyrata]
MESKSIVEALKNKGITGIGAARFCWGGEFGFLVPISLFPHSFYLHCPNKGYAISGTSNLMNHTLRTLVVYPKGNKEDNGRGIRLNVYGT